jgi:NADH:ubiquinone oxidoreductase subunit 6 (subunit J)
MLRKIFSLKLILLFLAITTVFSFTLAQTNDPIISIESIIGAITPLVIFGVTWLVQKIKPTLMGWNIVWIVVPILSLIATAILTLIDQATQFWSQLLWNFLSVAVAQLILQLTPEKRFQNTKAREKV